MSTEEPAARVARLQARATGYALSRPFLARLWRTVARYVEVRVSRLAAFVTYYGFLALFPLAALGFAVLGILSRYLPELDDAVVGQVTDHGGALGLTPEVVEQLQRAAVGLGLISLAFLLYAGVRFMEALREALALVFGGARPRGRIAIRVGADVVLLLLFGLVLIGSIVLSTITTISAGWLTEALNLQTPTGCFGWLPSRCRTWPARCCWGWSCGASPVARCAGRPRRRARSSAASGSRCSRPPRPSSSAGPCPTPSTACSRSRSGCWSGSTSPRSGRSMVVGLGGCRRRPGAGHRPAVSGLAGGGDEPLAAALLAAPAAQGQQPDDSAGHEERPAEPAGERPGG